MKLMLKICSGSMPCSIRGLNKKWLIRYSIFHGTAMDTSLLIDHLPSYVFNTKDSPSIDQHLVLGISLGGHSAWQVLFADPRVTAGVVIIGCPDYLRKSAFINNRIQKDTAHVA